MINFLIYIVSTILTFGLGICSKKFKWNEQLPIAIQDIIIGLTVFIIAWALFPAYDKEELLNQIILALGGSGTAALGYDTIQIKKGE